MDAEKVRQLCNLLLGLEACSHYECRENGPDEVFFVLSCKGVIWNCNEYEAIVNFEEAQRLAEELLKESL